MCWIEQWHSGGKKEERKSQGGEQETVTRNSDNDNDEQNKKCCRAAKIDNTDKRNQNQTRLTERERGFTWVEGGFSELKAPTVWVRHRGPGAQAAAPTADCMRGQHRQGQSEGRLGTEQSRNHSRKNQAAIMDAQKD